MRAVRKGTNFRNQMNQLITTLRKTAVQQKQVKHRWLKNYHHAKLLKTNY